MFLKTLVTTNYASLVYYVLHLASPRIDEANILWFHMLLVSIHVQKHSSFSFIAVLFMPVCLNMNYLAQLERNSMGCVFLALPYIIIAICQLYSASEVVTRYYQAKDLRRSCQPRMVTGVKTATYVDCVSTIFMSTISILAGYCQCQTNRRAPRVICFWFLIFFFYHNNLKSCPISIQLSNCNFRIWGYFYLTDCCPYIFYYFSI